MDYPELEYMVHKHIVHRNEQVDKYDQNLVNQHKKYNSSEAPEFIPNRFTQQCIEEMRAKLQANPPTELIKRLVYYIIKSEGGGKNYLENIPERLAHTILDLLLLREMRVLPKKFPNELFQILFNHDDYKENLVEDTLQNVAELLSRSDSELLHEILTPRREHLDTLRALFGTKADKLKAQQLTAKYGTI